MKSLVIFLNEELLTEAKETVCLLKTSEEAKEYFKRAIKPGYTLQDDLQLSDESIDALYEYAHEHNLPAPIVGHYGNTNFGTAFRRWLNKSVQSQIEEFSFNKNSKYFKHYHNTNLKEDGKFIPSAQDYEELICFAYNKKFCAMGTDENIKTVGINKNKAARLINYYEVNTDSIDYMAQTLHNKCQCNSGFGKLKNTKGQKISNEWADTYESGMPNATPKTDIMSMDGKYCISLKEYGGSQIMSAKLQEAKATLLFALTYCTPEQQKEILPILANLLNINETDLKQKEDAEEIFDEFGPEDLNNNTLNQMIKNDPVFAERVRKSKEKGKNFEKQLNELILSKYPDYKRGLYIEAMTGNHKFTKESNCIANLVFVWDEAHLDANHNKIYTIDDYYKHVTEEVKSKVTVDFKSWPLSNRSSQTLKIITT